MRVHTLTCIQQTQSHGALSHTRIHVLTHTHKVRTFKALTSRSAGGQLSSGRRSPPPGLNEILTQTPWSRAYAHSSPNCAVLKTMLIRKSANASAWLLIKILIGDFFQGTAEWESALSLPPVTMPTQSGSAAHRASWGPRQPLGGGTHKCSGRPSSQKCSGLKGGPAPSAVSLPYSRLPLCSSMSWLWLGSCWERRAEGSEGSEDRVWERRAQMELALPGEASFPATPCPSWIPSGGSAHPHQTLEGKGVGRGHRARRGPWGR